MSERNFNTISPSATALLVMKAQTDIPFAREAAELVAGKEALERAAQYRATRSYMGRVIHFENRYKTIDVLLRDLQPAQILELSAGFSFRGLHMAQHAPVMYVDTDLPDMVTTKKNVVDALVNANQISLQGKYLTESLNVLDEPRFNQIAALFAAGPLTIVNEGLLMYLNEEEKIALCNIIRKLLLQRGGCWITADIYVRKELPPEPDLSADVFSEQLTKFLADHKVEENKFESYEAAEAFFTKCGFTVRRKTEWVYDEISILKRLPPDVLNTALPKLKAYPSIRQTWMLEAVGSLESGAKYSL